MPKERMSELPGDMSPEQAKINLLAERMQELYELGLDDDQVCEALTHLRDNLFSAIDEKIDVEIAQGKIKIGGGR